MRGLRRTPVSLLRRRAKCPAGRAPVCRFVATSSHRSSPLSASSFAALGVPAPIVDRLAARGITTPFPIQAATVPDVLRGRDVCGRAPTGSGKTLAFGLALVVNSTKAKPRRPTGLVLVPTRELAAQVAREL